MVIPVGHGNLVVLPEIHAPVTGMIHPPQELKSIIDKTAEFVGRLGLSFEGRVLEKEKDNPKFGFLKAGDPFHSYYKFRVTESARAAAASAAAATPAPSSTSAPESASDSTPDKISSTSSVPGPKIVPTAAKLVKPKQIEAPPPPEFMLDLPDISAQELDIIRLTAQFVARNGYQFHIGLMNREHKNPQFEFLKGNHPLNIIFAALVDSYTKVLLAPRNVVEKLKSNEYRDKSTIMEKAVAHMEWEQAQERARKKEQEEEDQERMAMAMIDWHEFVVVETIDFFEDEADLPAPATYEQLMGEQPLPVPQTREPAPAAAVEEEMETDEMEMEEEEQKPAPPPPQQQIPVPQPPRPPVPPPPVEEPPEEPPLPIQDPKLRILKEPPKRTEPAKRNVMTQVCPRCGQRVPIDEMNEHMRIELLDPKYREQQQMLAERRKNTALTENDAIAENLKELAKRRTDIFGGDQEVEIGKSIGEDEKKGPEKVTWDGHTASIGRTTSAAMAGMSLTDQIAAIHASKGLGTNKPEGENPSIGPAAPELRGILPPGLNAPRPPLITVVPGMPSIPRPVIAPMVPGMLPPPVMPGLMGGIMPPPYGLFPPPNMMPPPPAGMPGMIPPPPPEEEPGAKRQKMEQELNLVPEAEFIASHPDPVKIVIQVPPANEEKNEWNFQGQQVEIVMEIQATVQNIKEKIKEILGMPPNKQKLKAPGISILKDGNTIGFYNITNGTVITLGMKERGGRKK